MSKSIEKTICRDIQDSLGIKIFLREKETFFTFSATVLRNDCFFFSGLCMKLRVIFAFIFLGISKTCDLAAPIATREVVNRLGGDSDVNCFFFLCYFIEDWEKQK